MRRKPCISTHGITTEAKTIDSLKTVTHGLNMIRENGMGLLA